MANTNKSELVFVTFSLLERKLILMHANYFTFKMVEPLCTVREARENIKGKNKHRTENAGLPLLFPEPFI